MSKVSSFVRQKNRVSDEEVERQEKIKEEKMQILEKAFEGRKEVIYLTDNEISDIKKAGFLANLYQEAIKSPCVLRFYDNSKEVYSLALKRLNQNDRNEIVVTDTVMTEIFDLSMSSSAKREVEETLDYSKILIRTNKVNFYSEIFIRIIF